MTNQQMLAETFSDMFKSIHGCRARWAYDLSVEELERGMDRMQEEIIEQENWEEEERKRLAAICHVSVDQIAQWEREEDQMWKITGVYKIQQVDQEYIESRPVEAYEDAHYFELGKAA